MKAHGGPTKELLSPRAKEEESKKKFKVLGSEQEDDEGHSGTRAQSENRMAGGRCADRWVVRCVGGLVGG